MTTNRYRVWLGDRASAWAHRGYDVRGQNVQCASSSEAMHIVYASLGHDLVEVDVGDEGVYFYRTQEEADADTEGTMALAFIDTEVMP